MTKNLHFLPFASLPEIKRGKGIVNHLIASKKLGARTIHSGITMLPVGVPVPRHSHNTEEQVTVLKGTVKITLEDREQVCNAFDSTFISAGIEHEFTNVGDDVAYVMVIYGSVDVNRTFSATGETVVLGSDADRFNK